MGEDSRKQIRFIDSKYKTLFYVDDGENIVITQPNGERNVRSCASSNENYNQYLFRNGWVLVGKVTTIFG